MSHVVMGLDPASTRNMGVAIMSVSKTGKLKVIHTETVRFPDCSCDGERLKICYNTIAQFIDDHKISKIYIERSMGMGKVFVRNNLIEMTGSIKMSAHDKKVDLIEISPSHLKKVVTGNGRANKALLQKNIKEYFVNQIGNDSQKRSEHEYDGVGLVLCGVVDEKLLKYEPMVELE